MLEPSEDFLHDTRKWEVRNRNGEVEPFNGNTLFLDICKVTQAALMYSKQFNKDINPEVIGRIATIQVCAELQSIASKTECSSFEIPSIVIRNIAERKLVEISFPVAKAYILESAVKRLHELY